MTNDSQANPQNPYWSFCKSQPPLRDKSGIVTAEEQVGFSDMNLASRKANEAASRRFQAASWMQTMVGPLELSSQPSEEEFRMCLRNGIVLCNLINKIHPGAVSKIVENHSFSMPYHEAAPLPAYQYFENVRNFLVAVEELNLPSFEASDLDEGTFPMGLPVKVVDCILSLKAYHEWQQAGGHKPSNVIRFPRSHCPPKPSSKNSSPMCAMHMQGISKPIAVACESTKDMLIELGNHYSKPGSNQASSNGKLPHEGLENEWSQYDSDTGWVSQVCQKFVEVYFSRKKKVEMHVPHEALIRMVLMVLYDKQPSDVPVVVEFMLKRVIEEVELKCVNHSLQVEREHPRMLEDGIGDYNLDDKAIASEREIQRLRSLDNKHLEQLNLQRNELKELKIKFDSMKLECRTAQSEWEKELESLSFRLQGLVQAAGEYYKVAAENRELYNQVQDLKGNIRVYCRVRPFLQGQGATQTTVDYIGENGSITIVNPKQGKGKKKTFTFNKIFGPTSSQEEVFTDTQPLIRSVLDGYNVCIFAYGQTGSGKTFTMTGPDNPSSADWGVNFRALNDLFHLTQYRKDSIHYEVGVQMIEIYNEQVRDLLCSDGSNKKLEVRNKSQQNGLNVPDASMVSVHSTDDVLNLMKVGHHNRTVGATALNDRSSRSHSVLTVHIKGKELASGAVLRGCLHLVDLAGSERVDKSEATGDRLKEAQHINKSLSALGDVIAALAQKSSHVPYRNSKLTQLLQDSLGGHAKTLMFVHVSPDLDSYGETISTLKFAQRAAGVELGAAHSNKESGDVLDLRDQVAFLKEALAKKDGELERVRREACSKMSYDDRHEKLRTNPSHTNSTLHVRSYHRQLLEEVRQVQNSTSQSDYQGSDRSMQTLSPSDNGRTFFEPNPESTGITCSTETSLDLNSAPYSVRKHGMSKNKMLKDKRLGETKNRIRDPHGTLTEAGQNGYTSTAYTFHDASDAGIHQNGHVRSTGRASFLMNDRGSQIAFADSVAERQTRHRRSHSYSYAESGDCSTEGSSGRQDELYGYEDDDEETSDFSEERWQRGGDITSPCSLRGDANQHGLSEQRKGHSDSERRNAPACQLQGRGPFLRRSVDSISMSSTSGSRSSRTPAHGRETHWTPQGLARAERLPTSAANKTRRKTASTAAEKVSSKAVAPPLPCPPKRWL
ncbi:hypothetical protein KP509_06G071600 [Ceratopteris richardii]|uniref:Uncharacterized protein n=1 Tax=Ceratopteris richardii TaxID=49495 RepID=A0A8T2UNZ3_CERRI|nr:hypothetical protein KP509_06G071600 [Ceratopteris richardii]KAH7435608.1 hypothetical protein KP509_06G071600 [Ceratopteris richardii]